MSSSTLSSIKDNKKSTENELALVSPLLVYWQQPKHKEERCNYSEPSCTKLSTVKCCNFSTCSNSSSLTQSTSKTSTFTSNATITTTTTSSSTNASSISENSSKTTYLNGANLLNSFDGNLLHFNVNINNYLPKCSNSIINNISQLKCVDIFSKKITTIISECINSSSLSDIEKYFGAFLKWSLSFKRGKRCKTNVNLVHSSVVVLLLELLLLLLCTGSTVARPNSSVVAAATGSIAAQIAESSVSTYIY